jgi:hypothetical protein
MLEVDPERRREHPEPTRVGSLPGRPRAPLPKRRAGFECVEFDGTRVSGWGHNGVMTRQSTITRHWNPRAIIFLVLAIVGLIGTWTYNMFAIIERRDFFGDWFGSGPAVGSLTMDLLIMAVAASVLMVIEGRRLGMKHVWAYIVFAGLTAIAFTFPLFLANRERRLQQLASEQQSTTTAM